MPVGGKAHRISPQQNRKTAHEVHASAERVPDTCAKHVDSLDLAVHGTGAEVWALCWDRFRSAFLLVILIKRSLSQLIRLWILKLDSQHWGESLVSEEYKLQPSHGIWKRHEVWTIYKFGDKVYDSLVLEYLLYMWEREFLQSVSTSEYKKIIFIYCPWMKFNHSDKLNHFAIICLSSFLLSHIFPNKGVQESCQTSYNYDRLEVLSVSITCFMMN